LSEDVEEVTGDLPVKVKFADSSEDAAVVHIVLESGPISIIEGPKNMIHEFLHDGRTISRSKRHDIRNIKPICCFEG